MPSRNQGHDDGGGSRQSSFKQRHQQGAAPNKARTTATTSNNRKSAVQDDEDDVWDDIMSADTSKKGGYDSDGPNKMSLNFWLKSGESCEISFIDEKPVVFQGHTLKCVSPNSGKNFYRTEACGKAAGQDCAFCDQSASNKNISKPKRILMFRIVDSRGQWNADTGEMDEIPALKFFQPSTEFAQQIGVFKNDENLDGLTSTSFVLVKNERYAINVKMQKKGAHLQYAPPIETEDELVEVEDIYYPLDYEEAEEFIEKFVPSRQDPPQQSSRHAGRGNQQGSFYGGGNKTNNRRGR